jgi:hypothetical protein
LEGNLWLRNDTNPHETDLSEPELQKMLAERLAPKVRSGMVIVDACHSGSWVSEGDFKMADITHVDQQAA